MTCKKIADSLSKVLSNKRLLIVPRVVEKQFFSLGFLYKKMHKVYLGTNVFFTRECII